MKHRVKYQDKILVLSLGRGGGCSQYTFKILEHLDLPYTLYQTTYTLEDSASNAIKVKTYAKNNLSFILNSIFRLPILFIRIYFEARRHSALLLPYFHFWNLAFIFAFKLARKPIILIEHDGIIHSGDELPMQQSLINLCMKHASSIIFLTHFVRNRVSPALLKDKPSFIIPHGIFDFEGLSSEIKQYSKFPTLLFFGRVNKYKGIEILLKALESISNFNKLIIAGKSSYSYTIPDSIKDKIEVIDRFLSKDEIAKLFNQSQILIMPYIEASQSGVASIAIANAMPTICTNVGGLKEQFILEANNINRGGV